MTPGAQKHLRGISIGDSGSPRSLSDGTDFVQLQTVEVSSHRYKCLRKEGRKEGNVLFNDALNTFYLRLYGVRHMVKDHSDSEKGNPLPPHSLLIQISSKCSFICTISQTG